MTIHCGKRALTLTWGILECIFFAGILNGWVWLKQIIKDDFYFLEECNITLSTAPPVLDFNTTFSTVHNGIKWICMYKRIRIVIERGSLFEPPATSPTQNFTYGTTDHSLSSTIKSTTLSTTTATGCQEQDDRIELIITLVYIIRNILMLPFGVFLDRYGTSRTRIFAIAFLACGSLMMLFSSNNFPWLCLPALTLLSISGFLILLTDLQIANLFGPRRYTVMAVLVGAYHSGGFMLFLVKTTREEGMSLQTSFMFLAVGMVPVLISTIALLPRSRIPWPLPLDYGESTYTNNTKDEKYSSHDWQRQISGGKKFKSSPNVILTVFRSSMYIWLLVWFAILSLKSFLFDTNIELSLANLGQQSNEALQYMNIYGLLMLFSLPAAPIIGIVMDWQKSFVTDPKTDQMMNILHAIVVTYCIAIMSGITALLPYTGAHMITCVLVTIEKVAALSTMCAILTHVHFPSECFGRCFGLVMSVSGITMLLQFAFKVMIRSTFHNQTFYVHLITLLLLLVAAGHPVNVWYHCKRGWIQDTSTSDSRKSVTIKLMSANNDPEEVQSVIEHVQCDMSQQKTYLQVTDL